MTPKSNHTPSLQPLVNPITEPPATFIGTNSLNAVRAPIQKCPLITRHPLHTYLLPRLCPVCYSSRERNLAFFDAQILRDSGLTSRENWGYSRSNNVVDGRSKRISRKSTAKGKLIPLICVEEGKLNRLAKLEEEEREREKLNTKVMEEAKIEVKDVTHRTPNTDRQSIVGSEVGSEFSRMVNNLLEERDNGLVKTEKATAQTETGNKQLQNAFSVGLSAETPSSIVSTSSWGLGWWGRNTPSSTPLVVSSPKLLATSSTSSPGSMVATIQAPEKTSLRNEYEPITKDILKSGDGAMKDDLGRNMSAMNKIMGFATGGTSSRK